MEFLGGKWLAQVAEYWRTSIFDQGSVVDTFAIYFGAFVALALAVMLLFMGLQFLRRGLRQPMSEERFNQLAGSVFAEVDRRNRIRSSAREARRKMRSDAPMARPVRVSRAEEWGTFLSDTPWRERGRRGRNRGGDGEGGRGGRRGRRRRASW